VQRRACGALRLMALAWGELTRVSGDGQNKKVNYSAHISTEHVQMCLDLGLVWSLLFYLTYITSNIRYIYKELNIDYLQN